MCVVLASSSSETEGHMTGIHVGIRHPFECLALFPVPEKTRKTWSWKGRVLCSAETAGSLFSSSMRQNRGQKYSKKEKKSKDLTINWWIQAEQGELHSRVRRGHMTWGAWMGYRRRAPRLGEGPCGHFAGRRSSVLQRPEKPIFHKSYCLIKKGRRGSSSMCSDRNGYFEMNTIAGHS